MNAKRKSQTKQKDYLWNQKIFLKQCDQQGINFQNIQTAQYQINNLIKNAQIQKDIPPKKTYKKIQTHENMLNITKY